VLDGIDCLTAFQPSRNRSLREFEERFADRFGDSFVPLPVAVDEDVGIGFSASGLGVADLDPILQGVPVVLPGAETKMLSERDERLIRLLHRHRGDGELTVTPSALGVKPDAQPLAGAITAMLTVLRVGSPDTLSINLQYATGPVGLLLGRFAHGDQGLATELARQIKQEDDLDPSVLVAEIVHAPGQRVVNILSRPILRPFVISYLGRAEGAGVQRLLTSELHVGVVDGRTVLWSPRHQKEVRPRLSSAHAAFNTSNLPVYRFLHALASRDSAQLRWSWGALDVCDKLPRVRSGSVILARARWSIDTDEFRRLKPLLTSPGRLVVALRTFCERHGLPRHVVLVEGDNTIPIDFENALSVESMLRLPLRSDRTMLEESLDAETDWATGADGRYNNEVVLPFTRVRRNGNTEARPTTNIERRALPPTLPILPGGPWLYLKVYCGVAVADRLLIDVLAPCLDRLESDGVTRGWFFLRYNDPQFHLRLRVRGAAKALHEIALPALRSALENEVSAGFVANVEMGSYVPEVRRYGGDTGIGAAEEIFCHDSAAVCAVVSLLREQELDLERNLIIVAAIDATLCEFKLSLADRFKLAERMKDAYQRELFAPGQSLREVLSSKFRDRRKTIEAMLDREARGQPFQMLRSILDRRAASCAGAVAAILQVESEGALTVSIADLLSSVAHMTANRLALALPRHQEFVAYDLLMQHYKSQLARQRQTREQ
jgi:thiopeptide-type bacteriocin biosynthesis protein